MPRTNVIERKSRLVPLLAVFVLLPCFLLLTRIAVLMVLTVVVALLSWVWPGLADVDEFVFETIGIAVTLILVAACLVIFYRDLRRKPITPDGRYCAACGYDLTGNTSGICPECGDSV